MQLKIKKRDKELNANNHKNQMEKIMLNTNVYSRPLDDLSDEIIQLEAESAKKIFGLSQSRKISIFTSEILFHEINLIKEKTSVKLFFILRKTLKFQ